MAVDTQWATREEVQALKDARAADRERIARLEVQFDESDKRLATKADVADVRVEVEGVRTEVERVRTEVASVKKGQDVGLWMLGLLLIGMAVSLYGVFVGGGL